MVSNDKMRSVKKLQNHVCFSGLFIFSWVRIWRPNLPLAKLPIFPAIESCPDVVQVNPKKEIGENTMISDKANLQCYGTFQEGQTTYEKIWFLIIWWLTQRLEKHK